MPLSAVAPPQPVPIYSGFDYVTVDSARRRVYAAHTASEALMIADTDSGKVVGQVRVGPLHGVAVDAATGHVFTGNGPDETISEVDPVTMKVLRSSEELGGPIDAIAYDPATRHIYADEDDGTRVFVLDAASLKSVGTVALPGHKPEYLSVDPRTHRLYQTISDLAEFVVVDPVTLKVTATVPTPGVTGNHALQYDPAFAHVLVAGTNATLAAFGTNGTLVGSVPIQSRVDQCDLDRTAHQIACAGGGVLSVVRDNASGAPTVVAQTAIPKSAHTVAIDAQSHVAWVVWAQPDGDYVQGYKISP